MEVENVEKEKRKRSTKVENVEKEKRKHPTTEMKRENILLSEVHFRFTHTLLDVHFWKLKFFHLCSGSRLL